MRRKVQPAVPIPKKAHERIQGIVNHVQAILRSNAAPGEKHPQVILDAMAAFPLGTRGAIWSSMSIEPEYQIDIEGYASAVRPSYRAVVKLISPTLSKLIGYNFFHVHCDEKESYLFYGKIGKSFHGNGEGYYWIDPSTFQVSWKRMR